MPVIAGTTVLAGGIAVTTSLAGDVAGTSPPALLAVTTTRRVEPMSAGVRSNVAAVAPETSAQLEPAASQRRHWYV